MSDELRSLLVGTAGLSVAAVIAFLLTATRGGLTANKTRLGRAVRLGAITLLLQTAHFGEELATGFHRRFPELLGLAPWSLRFFVTFNLVWLALWPLGLWGLSTRQRAALFPLWFLALGGAVNGVAHPLLSLRVGGYFPGLFTSPFVGLAGAALSRSLWRVTGEEGRRSDDH